MRLDRDHFVSEYFLYSNFKVQSAEVYDLMLILLGIMTKNVHSKGQKKDIPLIEWCKPSVFRAFFRAFITLIDIEDKSSSAMWYKNRTFKALHCEKAKSLPNKKAQVFECTASAKA